MKNTNHKLDLTFNFLIDFQYWLSHLISKGFERKQLLSSLSWQYGIRLNSFFCKEIFQNHLSSQLFVLFHGIMMTCNFYESLAKFVVIFCSKICNTLNLIIYWHISISVTTFMFHWYWYISKEKFNHCWTLTVIFFNNFFDVRRKLWNFQLPLTWRF